MNQIKINWLIYSSSLILLHFEFKEASSELRNGWIVIRTRWWPPPFADADGFSPSVSVHQMIRCVGIAENWLCWQRWRWWRWSSLWNIRWLNLELKLTLWAGSFLFFHLFFLYAISWAEINQLQFQLTLKTVGSWLWLNLRALETCSGVLSDGCARMEMWKTNKNTEGSHAKCKKFSSRGNK